jgi:hypothetical protein
MDETLFKFVPEPENVLEQLLNNSNDGKLFDGNLDDLLKLPVNKLYALNQERVERNVQFKNTNIEIKPSN